MTSVRPRECSVGGSDRGLRVAAPQLQGRVPFERKVGHHGLRDRSWE